MSHKALITGSQLTDSLRALGVDFILGGSSEKGYLHNQPLHLIAALAESNEARLRLALIPLFLVHPEFAAYAPTAASRLDPPARLTIQCYYSAAVLLERKYRRRASSLPDYFSRDLDLVPTGDAEQDLCALAERHQALSGERVNWLGTYQHAAEIWSKGAEIGRG